MLQGVRLLKQNFLHLEIFLKKLGAVPDEPGEKFPQQIDEIKERYSEETPKHDNGTAVGPQTRNQYRWIRVKKKQQSIFFSFYHTSIEIK